MKRTVNVQRERIWAMIIIWIVAVLLASWSGHRWGYKEGYEEGARDMYKYIGTMVDSIAKEQP